MLIPGVQASLRLRVEGPAADDWVVVAVSVDCDRGSWSFRGPFLTVNEARGLSRWLTRVSRHGVPGMRLEFFEPVLAFELVSGSGPTVVLRALFGHEGLPPFAKQHDEYAPSEQFRSEPIDIEATVDALRAAGDELRHEVQTLRWT